ncbi:hypothetical protein C2R22_19080 [Salinigranum rubrum]|uniref:Uncharacterized protein n=1 Tax=Salinigranum rubrum TaxID=755307 RepID=A0A2I8VNH8_9EURY|nr:hypothetical protein [Salinigranum rubrum]AUV83487.1 hypothetical protein C2R22_19080 [Salinigranum rubrum]
MTLSDIAAGIEVTTKQRERGVPTVDGTETDLDDRLATYADALPCTPEAAATVLERYASGTSVGDLARAAGVAPMTAAKTLHLCGEVGISPLGPVGREVVRDWLAGDLTRADAVTLTGATPTEFALTAYVEAHDPVPGLVEAAEAALSPVTNASVTKRETLAETMTDAADLV